MHSATGRADDPPLRSIPSVDRMLRELGEVDLPRPLMAQIVHEELERLRSAMRESGGTAAADALAQARRRLEDAIQRTRRSRIQPVLNATGVLIHTNLGRAPLSPAVIDQLQRVARGYCNLELDLEKGQRERRAAYLEGALALLCGAEAATVVNNCAAALVLVLRHFASVPPRNRVLLSRGELVQIGGGFRIPEILESAGAQLHEVGTTNQTSLDDYARAVSPHTAMILKVHRSNFYMSGFVDSPATDALAELARRHDLPLIEDLGSGATEAIVALLRDAAVVQDAHEPTPRQVLERGVDLVTFSGDKLFGGPQAGIIAGKRHHIEALKKNPLFRALRCDKLVLAALQATVDLHLRCSGKQDCTALHEMLRTPVELLRQRAGQMKAALAQVPAEVRVVDCASRIGGGSYPSATVASAGLELIPREGRSDALAARLRRGTPPVVAYIADGTCRLDLRTIDPGEDATLLQCIRSALA